jgi:hypothetical protein
MECVEKNVIDLSKVGCIMDFKNQKYAVFFVVSDIEFCWNFVGSV